MTHPDRFLLAGLMGFPVMHSRSPKLHNYWLARYGLTGTYLPLAIKADGLRAALRALPALGFGGVANVRVGRLVELDVEDASQVRAMCERLLANPLIEDYEVLVLENA